MKRSFWITLTISVVLCTIAVLGLEARNKDLTQRLAEAAAGGAAETGFPSTTGAELTGKAAAQTATANQLSEERVSPARIAIAGYVAGTKRPASEEITVIRPGKEDVKIYMPRDDDPYDVRKLPELLRAVEGLSVDELIATIEALPPEEGPDSGAKDLLLELAVLQDPRKVYRNSRLMEGLSESTQLTILAMFDPAAALRQLPPLDSPGREASTPASKEEMETRIQFATMLLGVDVDQGLQALLDAHQYDPENTAGGSFTSAAMAEKCIPELMEAMKAPEYAGLRKDLIKMTLNHTLVESGINTVAERAQAMELAPKELDAYLESLMHADIMRAEPAATIEWMAEVRSNRVPAAVVEWANLDLEAATDWLGALDPSPMRDRAIAEFARTGSKLDPEAAAAWAREIEDEKLREQTLQRIPQK